MTPKEKAEQIVDIYYLIFTNSMAMLDAKQCAIIAVDEQIELLLNISPYMAFPEQIKYLQEVKQEINKL
jgi:hypothetical protein